MNLEIRGTKAIRELSVYQVPPGQEGSQGLQVQLVRLGLKDHRGHRDQRVSQGTLEYQAQMDHPDQRVYKAPEDHRGHQGQKEVRVTKDRSAHPAMLVPLVDLEEKGTSENLVWMV